ncbi:MAG TPA: TfoX/Sxy family protein [Candidatus Limnocylindrales bacterium]|nr:TfoX/Sxy family protein [Candidatus Limnocylindrales bacterium]
MSDAGRPKPSFARSSAALVERFDAVAARHPEAQRRKMFGYPALFVGGNYATGLYEESWVVRLAADDLEGLLAAGGEGFSPMPGRSMKGWASLPSAVVGDDAALDRWLERAFSFAASLPAK